MTHTPGPWIRKKPEEYGPPSADWIEGDGRTVAYAYREADSRLIAAAPDLLEALEEISSRWTPAGSIFTNPSIERARAAIAKARGEDLPTKDDVRGILKDDE